MWVSEDEKAEEAVQEPSREGERERDIWRGVPGIAIRCSTRPRSGGRVDETPGLVLCEDGDGSLLTWAVFVEMRRRCVLLIDTVARGEIEGYYWRAGVGECGWTRYRLQYTRCVSVSASLCIW